MLAKKSFIQLPSKCAPQELSNHCEFAVFKFWVKLLKFSQIPIVLRGELSSI
jgi:hypothetical protein